MRSHRVQSTLVSTQAHASDRSAIAHHTDHQEPQRHPSGKPCPSPHHPPTRTTSNAPPAEHIVPGDRRQSTCVPAAVVRGQWSLRWGRACCAAGWGYPEHPDVPAAPTVYRRPGSFGGVWTPPWSVMGAAPSGPGVFHVEHRVCRVTWWSKAPARLPHPSSRPFRTARRITYRLGLTTDASGRHCRRVTRPGQGDLPTFPCVSPRTMPLVYGLPACPRAAQGLRWSRLASCERRLPGRVRRRSLFLPQVGGGRHSHLRWPPSLKPRSLLEMVTGRFFRWPGQRVRRAALNR